MRTATEIEALRIAAEILHPLDLMKGEGTRLDDPDSISDFAARECHLVHLGGGVYVRPLPAQVQLRGRFPIPDDQPCLINRLPKVAGWQPRLASVAAARRKSQCHTRDRRN